MKTTKEDFTQFKKEFTRCQDVLGLGGYQVYFKHKKLDDAFARINIEHKSMVASVSLASELEDEDIPFKDVKRSARHEASHLLLARVEYLANDRHATADELYTAFEEATVKIERLLR